MASFVRVAVEKSGGVPPYGAGLFFPDLAAHRRIFYIQQITLLLTICHQLELTRGALEG